LGAVDIESCTGRAVFGGCIGSLDQAIFDPVWRVSVKKHLSK
jgi:hypothetical protein